MQSIGLMVAGVRRKPKKIKVSANQFYPHQVERRAAAWLSKFFKAYGETTATAELASQGVSLDTDPFDGIDPDGGDKALGDFAGELFEQTQAHSVKVHSNFFVKLKIQNMGAAGSGEIKDDFVNRFVTNCKTATEQQKRDIANAIYSFKNSRGTQIPLAKQIAEINKEYSENKAKFIARNEVANLNELLSRTQAEESGFTCYEWLATHDMATRESHAAMDGMICRYDDDSVYSDDGGKTWKKRTSAMYHGAPGTDYNCRCCGAPYDMELYQEEKEPTEEILEEQATQKAENEAREAETEVTQARKKTEQASNNLLRLTEKMYSKQMTAGVEKFIQSLKKNLPSGDVEKAYKDTKTFAKRVWQSIKGYAIKKAFKERKLEQVKSIENRIDSIYTQYRQKVGLKDGISVQDETVYKTDKVTIENFEEEFEKLRQILKIPFSENLKNNFKAAVKDSPSSEWEWQDDGFFIETKKMRDKKIDPVKFEKEYIECKILAQNGEAVALRNDSNREKGNTFDVFVNCQPADLKKTDDKDTEESSIFKSMEKSYKYAIKHQGAKTVVLQSDCEKMLNEKRLFNKLLPHTLSKKNLLKNGEIIFIQNHKNTKVYKKIRVADLWKQ